ncbi:MAG TPA: hypothetical protein VHA33_12855 [Candidatus Angelobacter sp.]|nr:hypothetical protein [Candidatus Angelobacter sp.]
MRILKREGSVILACILIVAMVACSKNIAGTYVQQRDRKEYLELRGDGTFFLRERGVGVSGHYRVDGEVVTLTLDGSGRAIQVKLQGGTLVDDGGQLWVKGEKPLTASSEVAEARAAATVRTIITGDITYSNSYPTAGYARDLSTLGTGGLSACPASGPDQNHACLLDPPSFPTIGCSAKEWCLRGDYKEYKYNLTAVQGSGGVAVDFVVVATPVNSEMGTKSFCATSDGVPRYRNGAPLSGMISLRDCQSWPTL